MAAPPTQLLPLGKLKTPHQSVPEIRQVLTAYRTHRQMCWVQDMGHHEGRQGFAFSFLGFLKQQDESLD